MVSTSYFHQLTTDPAPPLDRSDITLITPLKTIAPSTRSLSISSQIQPTPHNSSSSIRGLYPVHHPHAHTIRFASFSFCFLLSSSPAPDPGRELDNTQGTHISHPSRVIMSCGAGSLHFFFFCWSWTWVRSRGARVRLLGEEREGGDGKKERCTEGTICNLCRDSRRGRRGGFLIPSMELLYLDRIGLQRMITWAAKQQADTAI
jgi:hypothetical protein